MKLTEPLWSFDKACEYLDVASTFLYRMLQTGKIRGYKVGGRWKVSPKELEKYLEMQSNKKYSWKV